MILLILKVCINGEITWRVADLEVDTICVYIPSLY